MLDGVFEALFRNIDIWRLLNGLIIGLVSSIATWLYIAISRRISDRRKFSRYSGLYETYTIDDKRIEGESVHVQWLGRNMLFAHNAGGKGLWEGYIAMNSDLPHVGAGHYRYKDLNSWGTHEVQSNASASEILIFASGAKMLISDTADARGVRQTWAYKWKRAPA
jgi:hypothetical protein